MRYTTENSQVIQDYYYVVNFRNVFKPELMPIYFMNKNGAKMGIKIQIPPKKRKFYKVYKGQRIIDEVLPFILALGNWGKVTKWDYPKDVITPKDRRNYRILRRRRLRRMGIYTKIRPKKLYFEAPSKVHWVFNRQIKANSPKTDAQVFQLQRKPKRYYYWMWTKEALFKGDYFFRIHGIRYDSKLGQWKEVTIKLMKKDMIYPYLLSELIKIAENGKGQDFVEWVRESGISLRKRKQTEAI